MRTPLCVDFGTSSIRIALRGASDVVQVLDIGRVTNSQSIDSASIRSDVCIEADQKTVLFGELAHQAIRSGRPLAFKNSSPKLWLKEPARLGERVIAKLDVTRRDLLVGLLAYALYAANETGQWEAPAQPVGGEQWTIPATCDVRVAHPVWEKSIGDVAGRAMRQITSFALLMASVGDWSETSVEVLTSWARPAAGENIPEYRSRIDALEPVAAAVELLPGMSSSRKICVVVDVGAGTTDIGVFQSLRPDSTSSLATRLIPVGPTVSVFKAGDVIDHTLLNLISELYPEYFKRQKSDLEGRIRSIKETLFKYGRLQEGSLVVDLLQLEQKREMQLMAIEIRECLLQCLSQAKNLLEMSLLHVPFVDRKIEVVMAGGGAQIGFLRKALVKNIEIDGRRYEVNLTSPVPPPGLQMHGAGYMRLAVALGGVNPLYDSVIHEHEKLIRLPGLGAAKQRI
jgi:hypothetical protein